MTLPTPSSDSYDPLSFELSTRFGTSDATNKIVEVPAGIRDYVLCMRIGHTNQLSFETFETWNILQKTIHALGGSVWSLEAHGAYSRWEFSCYRAFNEVASAIDETLGVTAHGNRAFALECESRMLFNGWADPETAAILALFKAREAPVGRN